MELLHQAVDWIVAAIGDLGYPGIVFLMFLESSFFPFPSEVVMIPAGYHAFNGDMNFWVASFMGIFGSLLGAIFNYYLAVWLGQPFLEKWGKYFFLKKENLFKVEGFFLRHGEVSTFTGRLIPGVRQYISFPAGLARMNIPRFLFFTGLGAGIWCIILVYIGYLAGQNEELIHQYKNNAMVGVLVFCSLLVVAYVWINKNRKKATIEG